MNAQELVLLSLQASVIVSVFALGLEAAPADATFVLRQPRLLLRSVVAMFVAMPLLAVLLGELLVLTPQVKIALVCLSISPIPPLLPKKEGKAGGHSSYALGLMLCMAVLALLLMPLWLTLLSRFYERTFALAHGAIVLLVLKMIVVPMLAGMLLHRLAPNLTRRLTRPAVLAAQWLLPVVGLVVLVATWHTLAALLVRGNLYALLTFIAAGLVVGHLLGGPTREHRIVLAMSTASRHPGVAIGLAAANYPQDHAIPGLIVLYLLLGIVVSLVYMKWQQGK